MYDRHFEGHLRSRKLEISVQLIKLAALAPVPTIVFGYIVSQFDESEFGRDALVFHELSGNINCHTDAGLSRACPKLEESTDLCKSYIYLILRIIAQCHVLQSKKIAPD